MERSLTHNHVGAFRSLSTFGSNYINSAEAHRLNMMYFFVKWLPNPPLLLSKTSVKSILYFVLEVVSFYQLVCFLVGGLYLPKLKIFQHENNGNNLEIAASFVKEPH